MENRFLKEKLNLGLLYDDDTLHVAFGVDKNYFKYVGVVITSILEHNDNCYFHILIDSAEKNDVEKIEKTMNKYGSGCSIYFINDECLSGLKTTLAWSRATYYRLMLGEILPDNVGNVLYLDADILCLGKLDDVRSCSDLIDKIAVVPDPTPDEELDIRKKNIGMDLDSVYFCAGVMVLYPKKWKECNAFARMMDLLENNNYPYLDQDALNIYFADNKIFLPFRYNVYRHLYEDNKDAVLLHFVGTKPWCTFFEHSEQALWLSYLQKSYWNFDEVCIQPRTATEWRIYSKILKGKCKYRKAFVAHGKYLKKKIINIVKRRKEPDWFKFPSSNKK